MVCSGGGGGGGGVVPAQKYMQFAYQLKSMRHPRNFK